MVQLKRHGRIYFFKILILFVFSGCSKCVQNKVADFAFSPDELLINPYVEGDTLLFTSENQDSIVYICTKRELRRSKYYEISYEDAKLYHDDCMGDYYETDGDLTILEGSDSSAGIAISLSFLNSFLHPTDAKEISLQIHANFENGIGIFNYYFEEDTILKSNPTQLLYFYPVKQIGPTIFTDVYELVNDTIPKFGIQKAYYSITDGVIGFESKDGLLFYINTPLALRYSYNNIN